MINSELALKLNEILGVDKMPEEQRNAFSERVGDIVIDASVTKLLLSLDDADILKVSEYMDKDSGEDIFVYLSKNFPEFEAILEEEIGLFQSEAVNIMS